jgi:kinesin family protein 11
MAVAHPFIQEIIAGYNCAVITFSMVGCKSGDESLTWEEDPLSGIFPRTCNLFNELENQQVDFSVRVSFLQIWGDELVALLSPENCVNLKIVKHHTRNELVVQNLDELQFTDRNKAFGAIQNALLKINATGNMTEAVSR